MVSTSQLNYWCHSSYLSAADISWFFRTKECENQIIFTLLSQVYSFHLNNKHSRLDNMKPQIQANGNLLRRSKPLMEGRQSVAA